jgi:hypothetical protein
MIKKFKRESTREGDIFIRINNMEDFYCDEVLMEKHL